MDSSVVVSRNESLVSDYSDWSGEGVALWWLGQAGFLLRYRNMNIIVDAYLSNALAEKYKGQRYPHLRMMDSPISMNELNGIDYCLMSHSHSDHMDPGLIPLLQANNPTCIFIAPEAVRSVALERGVREERFIGMNAGDSKGLGEHCSLTAIPSAHEELKQDASGRHYFLGYILKMGGFVIFHPGDSLPYAEQAQWLQPHNIHLALMPVNGRDEELSRNGIAGNFDFSQALTLMKEQSFQFMVVHHYGMFEFNTLAPADLDTGIRTSGLPDRIFRAQTGFLYQLSQAKTSE